MVFPVNIQDWFPVGLTGLSSLQSKGLSRVLSNITVQKHQDNLTAAKTKSEELKSLLTGRNLNNLRYGDDTTLMAESEEELKSLLIKVKEESEKAGLKLNIQNTKIMASGPITSWQIDGETVETVTDFIFLGSKITADGDCSHEIKTLAPWKKSYDQPGEHIKMQRHYLADKGPSSQSYGFSSSHVWMWELDHKES